MRPRPLDTPAIVCFSAQDWWYHNRAHSDFQLMTRVSAERRVLLVNSLGLRVPAPGRSPDVLPRLVRKLRSMTKLLRSPREDLPDYFVYTPLILPLYGSERGRRLGAAVVRLQVRGVMWWLRIRRPVFFVTLPTAWDVISHMVSSALIYNRSDKHSSFPEVDADYVRSREESLLREAGVALYVSHALMEHDSPLVGDRAVFLDHGVDLEHFTLERAPVPPEDVAGIAAPVVGFFGAFDDYTIDFDLLERVAVDLPDATLLLVGPAYTSMDRLTRHANVVWLGARSYEAIPSYGRVFDVALMPWLRNDWIRNCNPIKLKEYLALGLPVVSTDYPDVHRYSAVVDVASSADEFVELVRAALGDGGSRGFERRASVADASWDVRASELLRLCDTLTGS